MREFRSFSAESFRNFMIYAEASQHWNDSYHTNLLNFDKWLAEKYPASTSLAQEMVDEWCAVRPAESNNSNLARTNVVIAYIKFMRRRGLTDVKEPDRPKQTKCTHLPHAFTEDELTKFFYTCDHIEINPERKSQVIRKLNLCVIFRLYYGTGLRPSEAVLLKRTDVDLEEGVLNVAQSKGHDQHYTAIHESLIEILKEFDKRLNELIPDRAYFFAHIQDGHYSMSWFRKKFHELWQKANPSSSHTVTYDFRHNYAIENINSWGSDSFDSYMKLYYLSKTMGHCKVDHTRYYYSLVPRMADILAEKSETNFNELIPEVIEDEEYW